VSAIRADDQRTANAADETHVRDLRSQAAFAFALTLGALGVVAVAADAERQPFPVALSVTGSSRAGSNEVAVVAESVSGAKCALDVRVGRVVKSFPGAPTTPAGTVTWRWLSTGVPSDVPWEFTATCRLGSWWSRRRTDAELGFPSQGGALVTSPSTVSMLPGASCDLQGVCFADDPFPVGECTWYVAGRRPDLLSVVHGSAGGWLEQARGHVPEGWLPVAGAVAVWLPYHDGAGEDGHVAYVAAVSAGRVLVDDSNWLLTPTGPGRQIHEHWVSAVSPSGYIYGGPAGAGPPA
jgi:surface antigen